MAIELADIQIKVLKDVNDGLFDPTSCPTEEFGAMRTLYDMGLISVSMQVMGKKKELTEAGREQIEEY